MLKKSELKKLHQLWEEHHGFPLWQNARKALENYAELLGFADVEEAIVNTTAIEGARLDLYRYCAGICRKKMTERMEGIDRCPTCGACKSDIEAAKAQRPLIS